MPPDEGSFADRFDDYLDALVGGSPTAAPDPALGQTAQHVHTLRRTPTPDASFVARLEENLMGTALGQTAGSSTLPPMPAGRRPAHWWRPSFVARGTRHRNMPALIATALVLLLTLMATYGTTRLLPSHGDHQAAMIPATAGTPTTPAAAACPLPIFSPTATPMTMLNGTPVPPSTKTILPLPKPPAPLGVVTVKQPFPDSTPADAATVAAIRMAVQDWQACGSTPPRSASATPPVLAMFSGDYFRRMTSSALASLPQQFVQGQSIPWWQIYTPWSLGKGVAPTISDVRQLPDGRVGAIVNNPPYYPYVLVFIHQGDRWLIDELALAVPSGTPVADRVPLPSATSTCSDVHSPLGTVSKCVQRSRNK